MKTIWKWILPIDGMISAPIGAKVLDVQSQDGEPCLWLLVDPSGCKVDRKFTTYGTGHQVPDDPGEYVGTYQLLDGALVFHVFEEEL